VNFLFDLCLGIEYDVQGFDGLNPEGRYLILGNHQAMADILVLFYIYRGRVPFPRFFMKRSLLWMPIIGYVCWVLDSPFMYRLTKTELKQRPELRGRDLEITRRACQKYRGVPVTVVNYMEGTRGTPAKRIARGSPYKHLLRPKTDSVEFMLNAMGDLFDGIIDLTIAYAPGVKPNFVNLLSGGIATVKVRARVLPVPHDLLNGDLRENLEMQIRFRAWVSELWARKDAEIDTLQRQFPATNPS
ncbi:MAG: acetyltransferase, partial [Burkholderiales bacterium]